MAHEGKILCVNVNSGGDQKGAARAMGVASVAALMSEEQPDVVFLQDLKW